MPGLSIQKSGFVTCTALVADIANTMIGAGFTQVFPAAPGAITGATQMITLEAGVDVDSLSATQPWRVAFKVDNATTFNMFVATPLQLPNDGTIGHLESSAATQNVYPAPNYNDTNPAPAVIPPELAGILGTAQFERTPATIPRNYVQAAYPQCCFIDRSVRLPTQVEQESFPMSYRLAITDRGFFLHVWEDASDPAPAAKFSWVCVQRPVDHVTGATLVTGHCPVFCVYMINSTAYKFVVRENDVLKPTRSVTASADTPDSASILNVQQQVSITEANRYVINFPNGLNTPRYAYTEELDMMAYTSADVVSEYTDVPLTVYGEATPRQYKAMSATAANNTNMRVLMLSQGGGIS